MQALTEITTSALEAIGSAALTQGSTGWHAARIGCVTASRVADVVARTRSGYAAARQTYMGQLMAERLTGMPTETFQTTAMRWGSEMEPHAVTAYEEATGIFTERVGFIAHPRLAFTGASPDRVIDAAGLLEVKCPATATHIDTLLSGEVPARYNLQMQWQLACSGREWCDFVSFDPRMPDGFQCFITRVERDPEQIAQLEMEVSLFLVELEAKLKELEQRCDGP